MSTYGTTAGVAGYVKRLADATTGLFTATTKPSLADVEGWLDGRSAQLTIWLVQAGYQVPVTLAVAKQVLDYYANIGAAGNAELSQISAGYSANDQNRRENKFMTDFYEAEAFIKGGGLGAVGVPTTGASSPIAGIWSGGKTSGGQNLAPIFTRRMFQNVPGQENGGSTPEADPV